MELGLYEYLYSPDVVRMAVVLGVLVSALFYERVQLTSGGAIVPAFLAVSLLQPAMIAATLLAALGTWVVVHRWLPHVVILYGRRRVEVEYLVGLLLVFAFAAIAIVWGGRWPQLLGFTAVGMLIPGIVAHDMGRQGPIKTLFALAATTGLLWVTVFIADSVLTLLRVPEQPYVLTDSPDAAYPEGFLLVAVGLSVLCSIGLYARWRMRSGGFVTAAYLAFLSTRPLDLLFVFACAGVTYLIVVRLLIPRMLLFGRRKLTTMMLVSALVTWTAELVIISLDHGGYAPCAGLTVVTLIAPALLANDAQRQGWPPTLFASALGGVIVLVLVTALRVGMTLAGFPAGF